MKNKNHRICIIGAGPGGLSAAEALKELGYTRITIIEKLNRVGGQAYTLNYLTKENKKIPYDLGSISLTSSKILTKLIKRSGMQLGKILKIRRYSTAQRSYLYDAKKYRFGYPLTFSNIFKLTHDVSKLVFVLFKYRKILKGFHALSAKDYERLSKPYEEWLDSLNLWLIKQDLQFLLYDVMMYGHKNESSQFPAMLALRLLWACIKSPPRFLSGNIQLLNGGNEELWDRIANNHNVMLNATITRISRDYCVNVELNNGKKLEFDKLIITCSPEKVRDFLDLTVEEFYFTNQVSESMGWRMAFTAKHLKMKGELRTVTESLNQDGTHLLCLYPVAEIDQDTTLFSAMIKHDLNVDIESVKNEVSSMLNEHFGATDVKWVSQAFWAFDSFYNCTATKNKVHQRINKFQGTNHTYYLGGTLSGHLQATVVEYSYQKINEYFGS